MREEPEFFFDWHLAERSWYPRSKRVPARRREPFAYPMIKQRYYVAQPSERWRGYGR